jgi:hypothetical protein
VAPLLRCSENYFGSQYQNSSYSNYHLAIDVNGYYAHSPFYYNVLNQEIRGLIERKPSPLDKRVKLLFITKKGLTLLNRTSPTVIQLQDWLLSPLTLSEKKVFIKSLQKLIDREDEPQKDLGSNSKKNKPSKLN